MAQKNPFTPTFGKAPLVLAGRDAILRDMDDAFDNGIGDPNLVSIFVGARGTGKTALLSAVSESAESHGWISASVSAIPGMLDDILEESNRKAAHLVDEEQTRHLTGIQVGNVFGASWETERQGTANWRTKMTESLDRLNKADCGLLITVDEVNPSLPEVKELVAVYQHFVREERQVSLVMAGLPHRVSSLLTDSDITFLRRARRHSLARVSDADIAFAFRKTAQEGGKSVDEGALEVAVEAIQGFPYMLQLVGHWAWKGAEDKDVLDAESIGFGISQANLEMRSAVLESTYLDLSKGDKRFLAALLACGDVCDLGTIAKKMGVTSGYASNYKRRLLDEGVIAMAGSSKIRLELRSSRDFFEERLSEEGF